MNEPSLLLVGPYIFAVDHDDLVRFSDVNWRPARSRKQMYACAFAGSLRGVYLHRAILDCPPEMQVDHKDGNTFNCTRSNLRIATHSQNMMNRHSPVGRSGFRGVIRHKSGFVAKIKINQKAIYLGKFNTAKLAHEAYKKKAEELFGDFAVWNSRPQ